MQGSAWFRLVLLGLLLSILATVALTSILEIRPLPIMRIGELAIVSGMAVGLLSVKIVRAPIPWDWLASGLFLIGVGQVLAFDRSLSRPLSLGLFTLFALGSAAARIWIGFTAHPRRASAWIYASGVTSALAASLVVCTTIVSAPVHVPLIIALDVLVQGLAIAAFGFESKMVQ